MNPRNPDPGDLEDRLREVLREEAARINPGERRTEILAMTKRTQQTQQEGKRVEPPRRWLIPAAAAASVALIGAAVWGVSNAGGSQQVTPAATSTSTTAPTQAPTAAPPAVPPSQSAPSVSPSAAAKGALAGATSQVSLPAYFVGAKVPTGNTFGLYREFVRTAVPAGATQAQKARAAVAVAIRATPFNSVTPYLKPWAGTSVTNLTVDPSRITITLSGPGAPGFTAAQTKLAVQQLVWTAQAAVGQGNIPVKFVVTNGTAKLFGTYPGSSSAVPGAGTDLDHVPGAEPGVRDRTGRRGRPVLRLRGHDCLAAQAGRRRRQVRIDAGLQRLPYPGHLAGEAGGSRRRQLHLPDV